MNCFRLISLFITPFLLTSCTTDKGGSINEDKSDTTVSITDFEKTDDGFLGKINNNIETFSFINRVNVPKDATWSLYSDVTGKTEIPTKTIECNVGSNFVYLLVNKASESIGFYKVNVYRYNLFTVSFDTRGGNQIESQSVQEDSLASRPNDPTRAGCTFDSWDWDFSTPITQNLTISAIWIGNKHTITFNPNGGVLSISNTQIEVEYGKYITLPTASREGYSFVGWYYKNQKITNGEWLIDDDITLMASWSGLKYSITYNPNGGRIKISDNYYSTNSYTDYNVTFGSSYTLKIADKTGYTFDGWFEGETLIESGIWNIPRNISVDASWTPNVYSITFVLNGGSMSSPSEMNVTYNETFTLPIPTRDGFEFSGWLCNGELFSEGTWVLTENIVLEADWHGNTYRVTPSIPSTASTYSVKYHVGEEIIEKEYRLGDTFKPLFNNHTTFKGWYYDAAFTQPFITSEFKAKMCETVDLYAKITNFNDTLNNDLLNDSYSVRTAYIIEANYSIITHFDLNCPADGDYSVDLMLGVTTRPITITITLIHSDSSTETLYNQKTSSTDNQVVNFANAHLVVGETIEVRIQNTVSSSNQRFDYIFKRNNVDSFVLDGGISHTSPINVVCGDAFDLGTPYNATGFYGWYTEQNGNGIRLTDEFGKSLNNWNIPNNVNVYPYYH